MTVIKTATVDEVLDAMANEMVGWIKCYNPPYLLVWVWKDKTVEVTTYTSPVWPTDDEYIGGLYIPMSDVFQRIEIEDDYDEDDTKQAILWALEELLKYDKDIEKLLNGEELD